MRILNIDTLEFGIDIEHYDSVFKEFIGRLSYFKKIAQEEFKEQVLNINGINFVIQPKGMGFYAYKLVCEDFYICFAEKDLKNNSPIFVRFMSQYLWKDKFEKSFETFMNWFKIFECHVFGTRISRLDVCFDTDEIGFYPEDKEKFVTRARKLDLQFPDSEHYIGKKFSGFVIGKGSPLSCRIYNKSLEILSSSKLWFKEIWKQYGWLEDKDVWRVEFQIRRKILKELSIFRVEDIFSKMQSIWAYLTQKWLLMKEKSNKNVTRNKVTRKWKVVQKANSNYNSTPQIRECIKKGNKEKLYIQCEGLMKSIAALEGTDTLLDTYTKIENFSIRKNKKQKTTFKQEVEKRRNRYIK